VLDAARLVIDKEIYLQENVTKAEAAGNRVLLTSADSTLEGYDCFVVEPRALLSHYMIVLWWNPARC
jgi:hypothetical protein